jgi:hypothetical protein
MDIKNLEEYVLNFLENFEELGLEDLESSLIVLESNLDKLRQNVGNSELELTYNDAISCCKQRISFIGFRNNINKYFTGK